MRALAAWIVFAGFAVATLTLLWITAGGLLDTWRIWRNERNARPLRLRVATRTSLSDDTFAITLAHRVPWQLLPWRRLPAFHPGQHLVLHLPLGANKTVARAYSIAAWQSRPDHYVLGIKREAEGLVSHWLYDRAHPGLDLRVTPPKGSFHSALAATAGEVVLIAGGIGVTPMRAMLQEWRQRSLPPRAALHFTARTPEQLYFHDEFVAMAEACPWFRYFPRLTQPPPDWAGLSGRLTAADMLGTMHEPDGAQIFVCANAAMEDAIIAGLSQAGIGPGRIHRESFGIAATRNDIQAEVKFNNRAFAYDGAPTLLHALTEHGFDIPAECRAGECGLCRLAIIQGRARDIVSGQELQQSLLACCAVPLGDIELRG